MPVDTAFALSLIGKSTQKLYTNCFQLHPPSETRLLHVVVLTALFVYWGFGLCFNFDVIVTYQM